MYTTNARHAPEGRAMLLVEYKDFANVFFVCMDIDVSVRIRMFAYMFVFA